MNQNLIPIQRISFLVLKIQEESKYLMLLNDLIRHGALFHRNSLVSFKKYKRERSL